ncbi:MAG: RMD1 family protein [Polyangiaceae bacterium]|nr:RMD1 family protein [Polyangiaceae bacterium]
MHTAEVPGRGGSEDEPTAGAPPGMALPFANEGRVVARAYYLGQRFDPRRARDLRLAFAPYFVLVGARGAAVLFRYGAVVLFDVHQDEEHEALESFRQAVVQPFALPEVEEVALIADRNAIDRPIDGVIRLTDFAGERIQLVADVLAKSVVLAHYESAVNAAFDHLEPLAESLARGKSTTRRAKALLQHIGSALLVETQTIARVEVSDKPEVLWDLPELERLYARLADEYELIERHVSLERKLALVSRTAQTVLELLQNSRSLRVEWYIVLLILFEILLTLYELFIRSSG